MTNEQIWAQSTVMERCETLKARLDHDVAHRAKDIENEIGRINSTLARIDGTTERLERNIQRLKNGKATLEWAECTSREIEDLARRVAEIEKGRALGVCEPPQAFYVDGSGEYIGEFELARLRRVEKAARVYVGLYAGADLWANVSDELRALGAALDSEPER